CKGHKKQFKTYLECFFEVFGQALTNWRDCIGTPISIK
ncbi:MAG: hypothetical protein ACI8RA_000520, partial [Chlamydiales bacterium]